MKVENQSWSNVSRGLLLAFSSYNTIWNCEAYNNQYGFYINRCKRGYNTIESCTAYNNERDGIYLGISNTYNNVTNCEFYSNENGIHLYGAKRTLLCYNTVYNNEYGIFIESDPTNRNTLYHNNLANNDYNAQDDANPTNYWDDGYPSGGNYWDDYTGVDNYSGPDQNISGSDGIGDTPYIIEGNQYSGDNQDNYPLMEPVLSVELLSPANGSYIDDQTPTFNWEDVAPIYEVNYTLLVATDGGFSNIVINETSLEESEYTSTTSMPYDTYYWKVKARVGTFIYWSEIWNFTVELDITPPTTPHLIEPVNNSTLVITPTIFFDWTDAYDNFDIDYYTLQVATDEGFANIIVNETADDSENILTLTTANSYYWRVRAVDIHGLIGDWSEIWMFTRQVDINPPEVELLYPVGGEYLNGEVTIQWDATDDYTPNTALPITIEYRCSGPWQVVASNEENDGAFLWDTTGYPDGTIYKLRISTEDYWGNHGYDETYTTFTVDNTAPETTAFLDPATPDGENDWYISTVRITLITEHMGRFLPPVSLLNMAEDGYTMYRIDGGDWQEYVVPFTVSEDGEHLVEFYSVDRAGNEEPIQEVDFKIDRTVPIIELTVENTGGNTWLFTATVADETSGVAEVEFYVDGELLGVVTEEPYEWEYTGEGQVAQAIVYDNAGLSAASEFVDSSNQSHSQSHSSTTMTKLLQI
jgi:parallel beta-helix repeat protein